MAHDIVIRGGQVFDGTGAAPRRCDVAIDGERITAVGEVDGSARRVIDADGLAVTPGFIDIHTHLDAQIMWDPQLSSSCWHGITSVVLGNCGLSIAPTRSSEREVLLHLLESVEDIPGESLLAGNCFEGESFGDYLALLDRLPKGVNAGGMVGHCAVRFHAMAEHSMDERPATAEEVARMSALVDDAMSSGALGFSTSRTMIHMTPDGRHIPGTFADTNELAAFGDVLAQHGRGVFGSVGPVELADREMHLREIEWMTDVSIRSGRPITFAVVQNRADPGLFRELLAAVAESNARGARLCPQTQVRSVGVVVGLANITPFDQSLAWLALKEQSLEQKLAALRDPERRAQLIAGGDEASSEGQLSMIYRLGGDDVDARYDFAPDQSLWAIAKHRGVSPTEAFIDIQLECNGAGYFIFPFANHEMDAVGELLSDPSMHLGLADSGAHVGQICDTSFSTFFLHYWVMERGLFSVEEGVRKLTSEPAALFGLEGRGVLREGAYADLNVIDMDGLRLPPPEFTNDFPAGAGRFIQRASGYACTLVNGAVFMENGEHTGSLTGQTLRGGG